MVKKSTLFFLAKLAAVLPSIYFLYISDADLTFTVISALGFVCAFVFQLLLDRILNKKNISAVIIIIAIIACFVLGTKELFALIIILIFELASININDSILYNILAVIFLLEYFIFSPEISAVIVTFIILAFTIYGNIVQNKIDYYISLASNQKNEIDNLTKKISDNKRLIKTLKYTAALEERNRLAARIHDKIGHGISGSIIMLEASLLNLKSNPEKAVRAIEKAVANLRDGVDDIRMSLREERPLKSVLGINDLISMLEEFKALYNIQTVLKQSGRLDLIRIDIWTCIHENLEEALTNLLKHSDCTMFSLEITVINKIIKIEFKDNGKSKEPFQKGLGLEAIEERTIKANGRCFFNKTETGFSITNIFTV